MKRRLNLLCTILIIGFGAQLLIQSFYMFPEAVQSFKEGYEAGRNMGEEAYKQKDNSFSFIKEEVLPVDLQLRSKVPGNMPDSLYNAKTGKWIPVEIHEITVDYKREMSIWENLYLIPVMLVYVAALILIFISFIRLLLAINKSIIFEWWNVIRLKHIGVGFIVAFVCHFIIEYVSYNNAIIHISLSEYFIDSFGFIHAVNLIFGFIALLLAEVFAIGLRLREQQELTI